MKSFKIPQRQQWYVDAHVQKLLVKRLFFYILASILFVSLPIAFYNTLSNSDRNILGHMVDVFLNHWPVMLTIALILPFAIYDMIKLSNRFAGPVYRLRRELQSFDESSKMKEVFFRDNDFWQDLALGVNRLTERINELETQLVEQGAEPTESTSSC